VSPKRVAKSRTRSGTVTSRLVQLVKQPHLAWRLEAAMAPQYLGLVNGLLARVTELQSNLLRMVPSTTRILGRPLSEVRRVLRLDAGEGFDLEAARQRIAGDNYAVRRFLADLVTDGWLIQERADHWKVTAKAKELQSESRGRLTRVKADGLVGELLARVRTINQDSKYAFKIDSVVLFGSYLSNRDRIGDVDVAIALRPRLQKKEAQEALEEAARARGPRSRNIVDDLFRPRREVQQAVKAKSSWLDVREISELEDVLHRSSVAYKVVYGYWQPRLKGKENN
jgi:predicted nucleotidyltransferase